jgi:uncharacterized repeat protein (TIGR03987 family)
MMIIVSSILITLALVFYSTGIWAERIARILKPWHVVTFWIGFSFDVAGTLAMHMMAEGKFDLRDPHTLTGQIALWLMLGHAIWATVVIRKSMESMLTKFHRFSIFVWLIWLIPYFGGMFLAMSH